MAEQQTARSEARSAAENTANRKPRTPSARQEAPEGQTEGGENTSGTETQQPVAVAIDPCLVVIAPNPKRVNSISHGFYAKYPKVGERSSHSVALAAGVRTRDISWDADETRRHILLGDDAEAFLALETPEERLDFLKNKMKVPEKNLIKWGYMKAPQPAAAEPAPAEGDKATA